MKLRVFKICMFGDAAASPNIQIPAVLPDDHPHGSKHVGVKSATNVTACDNSLIKYMSA